MGALQLRRRGLRTCSLPFDWLFHVDDSLLSALSTSLDEDFANWLLLENLEELKGDERGTSPHYQYKDTHTGFRFIHDFHKPLEAPGEYLRVKRQYQKRIKRLYSLIDQAESFLMVLNCKWPLGVDKIRAFQASISRKWPGKKGRLVIVAFSQPEDARIEFGDDCVIIKRRRPENAYDYFQTNFEWEFLDSIVLRDRRARLHRFVEASRIPGGVCLQLFKGVRSIFSLRISALKYVIDLRLGGGGK